MTDEDLSLSVADLPCPRCGAAAGAPCAKRLNRRTGPFHVARHDAWHRWATGYAERSAARAASANARAHAEAARWPAPIIGGTGSSGWRWVSGESVVGVLHKPSGIAVWMNEGRSTFKRRQNALKALKAVLASIQRGDCAVSIAVRRSYEGDVPDLPLEGV